MGVWKSFCLIMGKSSQLTVWPMYARSLGLSNILLPLILPGQMARQRILKSSSSPHIRKLCQEDKASWDQVLDQILFSHRCCPHTSTGEVSYTFGYNRDAPIPIHKLIKVVEPYMGENTLGKRIEQSRVSLPIAAKMLEKIRANQKRYYLNRRSTHTFKVGDLVLKKYNIDKMELIWEPNYRIVKLPSAWSAVVENQLIGKSKRCKICDLKIIHPSEDWELTPSCFGRAAKFVNHPNILPDIDFSVDKPSENQKGTEPKYNLRRAIKAPTKLDL